MSFDGWVGFTVQMLIKDIQLCLLLHGMNGTSHRALFSFRAAQRGSLNKLSLFSNYSSWFSLLCSPWEICPDTVGILSFSLNHGLQYCQWQMAEVPKRPPKQQLNRNGSQLPPPDSKQTGAVDSSPPGSNTKKPPHRPSIHNKPVFPSRCHMQGIPISRAHGAD